MADDISVGTVQVNYFHTGIFILQRSFTCFHGQLDNTLQDKFGVSIVRGAPSVINERRFEVVFKRLEEDVNFQKAKEYFQQYLQGHGVLKAVPATNRTSRSHLEEAVPLQAESLNDSVIEISRSIPEGSKKQNSPMKANTHDLVSSLISEARDNVVIELNESRELDEISSEQEFPSVVATASGEEPKQSLSPSKQREDVDSSVLIECVLGEEGSSCAESVSEDQIFRIDRKSTKRFEESSESSSDDSDDDAVMINSMCKRKNSVTVCDLNESVLLLEEKKKSWHKTSKRKKAKPSSEDASDRAMCDLASPPIIEIESDEELCIEKSEVVVVGSGDLQLEGADFIPLSVISKENCNPKNRNRTRSARNRRNDRNSHHRRDIQTHRKYGEPIPKQCSARYNGINSATSTSRGVESRASCSASTQPKDIGFNVYNPDESIPSEGLRPVVIDGSNVAMAHGNKTFSTKGLAICIDYFVKRGHKVVAFVPQYRRKQGNDLLENLNKEKLVVFTPSRFVDGQMRSSYDDRFIVQYAATVGGIIVSTDNFRDLLLENEAWHDTIKNRLLMFTWVGDILMLPLDPQGKDGPPLDEFLRFPPKEDDSVIEVVKEK